MDIENNINYFLLVDSIKYYESLGYKYINVDWTVPIEISSITKPKDKKDFYINEKCLVASGEQSFLYLIINKKLEKGKYCCLTPCHRDENLDELHNNYFMKVELIDTLDVSFNSLNNMMKNSLSFFNNNGVESKTIKISENEFDIVDSKNLIELGSYGIREYYNIQWIFGTGLAEPRFTKVKKKCQN